jgi:ketosteroid isomerase-like protein
MASANLDLVRSINAAWERGDFSSAKWAHPGIEFVIAGGPDPASGTGVARMAENFAELLSAWGDVRVEVEQYRELDAERVLVLLSWSGRGKTSGIELAQVPWKPANLFHLHDGKVMRLVLYWDRERALADLGLAAEGDPVSE